MRILGIDYGEKRVGVALSDPLGMIAQPYCVISHFNDDLKVITKLQEIILEKKVTNIVLGIPYNMNGSTGFQAERVLEFGQLLTNSCHIEIIYEDERETSKQVKQLLKTLKVKKEVIDDRAAAIILQNYLDYKG